MASLDAFRALKSDFEKLAADGSKLPAWHDPTNFRAEAEAIRSRLVRLDPLRDRLSRRYGSAVLDRIEACERKADGYETMTTDAEGRLWIFEVPGRKPPDPNLVRGFCLCAVRAAVTVGFVEADASEDAQVFAWLAQLKARRPGPRPSDPDTIPCVIKASILLCEELATAAAIASMLEAERASMTAAAAVSLPTAEAIGKRRRSAVEPKLKAKGWSVRKWADFAGVDASAAYGYFKGLSTQSEMRKNLAEALDIPIDDFPQ
jgi:hypothetical protein